MAGQLPSWILKHAYFLLLITTGLLDKCHTRWAVWIWSDDYFWCLLVQSWQCDGQSNHSSCKLAQSTIHLVCQLAVGYSQLRSYQLLQQCNLGCWSWFSNNVAWKDQNTTSQVQTLCARLIERKWLFPCEARLVHATLDSLSCICSCWTVIPV